jgi:two-component system sensor histidine kinase RegB
MEWLTHSQTGFRQAARYLLGMRLAVIATQLVAIAVAETTVTLAHRAEALILSLLYGVLATLAWLWFSRKPPEAFLPVSLTLATDLFVIGLWLYFTGGYTNPLVSLLWHTPVMHDHHSADLAQLHLVGMWVTFALTAAILLLVVGTLARRLRLQQTQLSQFRENRLRDEQIIALGLSAAAVAHRLGTPLNTMTLLLDEIRSHTEGQASIALTEDLDLMGQQLNLCGQHLQQLTKAAIEARNAQLEVLTVKNWLARLRESATLLWPSGPVQWPGAHPDVSVAVDATLDQAVLNLLANALTASPSWVAVRSQLSESGQVEVIVEDQGDGLETALQGTPGEEIVDSRHGLGVGLFLSNATIQRLGGNLRARTSETGTTMVIDLPVARPQGEETPP